MLMHQPSLLMIKRFYIQLENTVRQLSGSERAILLGDMNARIGADYACWPECIDKFGVGKITETLLKK